MKPGRLTFQAWQEFDAKRTALQEARWRVLKILAYEPNNTAEWSAATREWFRLKYEHMHDPELAPIIKELEA